MAKRLNFSAAFKAKGALEAMAGEATPAPAGPEPGAGAQDRRRDDVIGGSALR